MKGKVSVKVGSQTCTVQSAQDDQITCQLSLNSAGSFSVNVQIDNLGYSNNNIKFTYDLSITSLSKSEGSVGGSLSLVINGQGFSSNSTVTICGNSCTVTQSSVLSITCLVSDVLSLIRC